MQIVGEVVLPHINRKYGYTVGGIPGFPYRKLFLLRFVCFYGFVTRVVGGMAGSVATNLETRGRVHRGKSSLVEVVVLALVSLSVFIISTSVPRSFLCKLTDSIYVLGESR